MPSMKGLVHRLLPMLCADCRMKLKRRYHIGKIKTKARSSGRKLRAGIHWVTIKGKKRKVKVLANGRWRFMKSR